MTDRLVRSVQIISLFIMIISYTTNVNTEENNDIDLFEEEEVYIESSLSLNDILPKNPNQYDKNRAPKIRGQPTTVYFHVTVLSLDSINEESMINISFILCNEI
uniref:Uncharacterized protein n=1 Tax=Cacopsylla melanoneura TaxID=428564 RepID=A0A8D9AXL9_9HEMI